MRLIAGLSPARGTLDEYLEVNRHSFSRAELLDVWSHRRLTAAVRHGSVVRILPGIYCGAAHALDPIVMGEALNLWYPRGLVTGELALHLYAQALPVPARVDLLVEDGQHLRAPDWVRLHQTGPLRAQGSPQGVASVVPERALLDAWRYAAPRDRRSVLYEALWARVCTWRQLPREAARTPRVAGRRELEQVLAWFAEGATSPLEVRAQHETFADERFHEFEWQVHLRVGARNATVDMLHRRAMLVVELDGERYHSTPKALRSDRARDADFLAEGYVTVRFGWDDVVRRPAWCRDRLLAIMTTRLAPPGSA